MNTPKPGEVAATLNAVVLRQRKSEQRRALAPRPPRLPVLGNLSTATRGERGSAG